VSIAALSRGILSLIFLVKRVETSASRGSTEDFAGIRSTSSNVRLVCI
jgi:hypothetical protein